MPGTRKLGNDPLPARGYAGGNSLACAGANLAADWLERMKISSFDEMVAVARQVGPVPIVVAAAHDPEVLKAVEQAQQEGIIAATLVGDWPAIEAYAAQSGIDLGNARLIHEPATAAAAQYAVDLARKGQAEVVVKGQLKTSELLSCVLNRHVGLRGRGLLTHVGIFEVPGRDRLVYLSDSGVVVYPDVYQKLEIINNAVAVAHLFGIELPKVAILAASDTVHPKIPASIDALALSRMADQGWTPGAIVDGPLGLELAISPKAAQLEERARQLPGRPTS